MRKIVERERDIGERESDRERMSSQLRPSKGKGKHREFAALKIIQNKQKCHKMCVFLLLRCKALTFERFI